VTLRSLPLRFGGMVLTLLLTSVLVFASTVVLPGDAAQAVLGSESTPESLAYYRHVMGLDQPAVPRYFEWLRGVATLDFGKSLVVQDTPVSAVISGPLVNTGILLLVTVALLIPLSLVIGTATAIARGSWFDGGSQTIMLALHALPEFTLGAILVLLFAFIWPILPAVSITVTPNAIILPVATLTLTAVAYTSRFVRAGVIQALASDHVQMARMKGLPERLVLRRHVLPNALGATVQAFSLVIGWLAGGIVVVEYLFAYPGLGSALIRSISARDVPVVQACTLIVALTYTIANALADLLTVALNPRLRTTGAR
jgi:peptide/nickel transport system permease protein